MATYNSFAFVLFLVLNACLGAFTFGYVMAELNMLILFLKHLYTWDPDKKSVYEGLLNALFPVGCIVGVIIAGNYFSKLGRRVSLLIADLGIIVGSCICLIVGSPGIPQMIGRFISGIAIGINSQIVPIYINEVSPLEINGIMGGFFQTFINLGILIAYLTGLTIKEENDDHPEDYDTSPNWWRFIFAFPIIISVIRMFFLSFIFRFDTPFSLINRNYKSDAMDVLRKIYKEEHVESIAENIQNKINGFKDVSYSELFTKYRKRITLALLLMMTQQFSGINAVVVYSSTLYKDGLGSDLAKQLTIVNSVVLFISAFVSGKICDKLGRRTLIMWGNIACLVFLVFMGAFLIKGENTDTLHKIAMYCTLPYLFSFGVSLGPIIWIYCPEILPEKGVSLAVIVNWFFCTIVLFVVPIAIDHLGAYTTYLFYAVCLVLSHCYMIPWLKETKNKTEKEIEAQFEGGYPTLLDKDDNEKDFTSYS